MQQSVGVVSAKLILNCTWSWRRMCTNLGIQSKFMWNVQLRGVARMLIKSWFCLFKSLFIFAIWGPKRRPSEKNVWSSILLKITKMLTVESVKNMTWNWKLMSRCHCQLFHGKKNLILIQMRHFCDFRRENCYN